MKQRTLLWIDDEIEMLKPHLMLLERRGYSVDEAPGGSDGLAMLAEKQYDAVIFQWYHPEVKYK